MTQPVCVAAAAGAVVAVVVAAAVSVSSFWCLILQIQGEASEANQGRNEPPRRHNKPVMI